LNTANELTERKERRKNRTLFKKETLPKPSMVMCIYKFTVNKAWSASRVYGNAGNASMFYGAMPAQITVNCHMGFPIS